MVHTLRVKATIRTVWMIFILAGTAYGDDLFSGMNVIKPKERMEAPAFALQDVDGAKRTIKEFKGNVILLNFWATWCGPCREEMPALNKLREQFKEEDFVVIAVAADRGRKSMHKVREFCKMHNVAFPVLLDPEGDVRKAYEVTALPTSYIIGRDGKFIGKILGARTWDATASIGLLDNLLKKE